LNIIQYFIGVQTISQRGIVYEFPAFAKIYKICHLPKIATTVKLIVFKNGIKIIAFIQCNSGRFSSKYFFFGNTQNASLLQGTG
jgi:hypothetical protein